jgi:superoxide dismutase, Fe-Mn family
MNSIREIITLLEEKSRPSDIEIVALSYNDSDLAPVISQDTIKFHWGKLAHGYAERFNNNQGDRQFNYAGAALHNIFFRQFRAPRKNNRPNGPVGNLINSKFKNWDNFLDQFKTEALALQGSGWIYLSRSGEVKTIHNHDMRTDILVLVDMWEHSYNGDYGADKQKYLDNIWRIIDWNVINSVWGQAYK